MNDDSEKSKKGFAGLSSMASHVEGIVSAPPSKPKDVEVSTEVDSSDSSSRGRPFKVDESKFGQTPQKSFWSQTWFKWTAGIVIVLVIIAALDDEKSKPVSNSGASNGQYTYTPASRTESPIEEMPPVGTGLVLSSNQIRYCLAQAIRIETWSENVNQYSDRSVDMFNLAVGDYNSRCANYRYKSSVMGGVRSEVESRRAQLAYEGLLKANMYR